MEQGNKKKVASVATQGVKQVPELTPGTPTPEVILTFQMACIHFFNAKKIEDKDRVSSIAPGFRDPHISAWYFANETKLKSLSYSDFWVAFKAR